MRVTLRINLGSGRANEKMNLYAAYNYTKGYRLFNGRVGWKDQVIGLVKQWKKSHPNERIDIFNVTTQTIVKRNVR